MPGSSQHDPKPGLKVGAGQTLGSLDVFLSPQDQAQTAAGIAEADLAARQAQVAMRYAQAQLDRLKSVPGTVPAVKLADLEESLARSRVAFEEAEKKRRSLPEARPDGSLRWKSVPLPTPIAGRVTAVHVAPGQRVRTRASPGPAGERASETQARRAIPLRAAGGGVSAQPRGLSDALPLVLRPVLRHQLADLGFHLLAGRGPLGYSQVREPLPAAVGRQVSPWTCLRKGDLL